MANQFHELFSLLSCSTKNIVITSYSIHYTKLYDLFVLQKPLQKLKTADFFHQQRYLEERPLVLPCQHLYQLLLESLEPTGLKAPYLVCDAPHP